MIHIILHGYNNKKLLYNMLKILMEQLVTLNLKIKNLLKEYNSDLLIKYFNLMIKLLSYNVDVNFSLMI